jgi:hypothetical protein
MTQLPFVRLLRAAQVALVTGAILLISSSGASAATTLAGETLTSPFDALGVNGATCNATTPSTFNFSTSGTASGPAVGRFTESGSFTLASSTGPLTSFSATFTIKDSAGTVLATGTKSLVSATAVSCSQFSGFSTVTFQAVTHYSVTSPFTESGAAPLNFNFGLGTETFIEGPFLSAPMAPQTKQDCMNGGFANFIDPTTGQPFKNQGQCIKFVVHS